MRRLNSHDVFTGLRLMKASGAKDALKKMVEEGRPQREAGIQLLGELMEGLGDSEDAFYDFISGPLEIPPADLKNMDFFELVKNLEALLDVVGVEEWKAFFTSVFGLMR